MRPGIDPVLVGVMITLQVAIGSATPPFGCDIFTAIAIFRRPYLEIIRGTPPFIVMLLAATVLLIAFRRSRCSCATSPMATEPQDAATVAEPIQLEQTDRMRYRARFFRPLFR
jgi:ABC-type amino acid transport system permease subunit